MQLVGLKFATMGGAEPKKKKKKKNPSSYTCAVKSQRYVHVYNIIHHIPASTMHPFLMSVSVPLWLKQDTALVSKPAVTITTATEAMTGVLDVSV